MKIPCKLSSLLIVISIIPFLNSCENKAGSGAFLGTVGGAIIGSSLAPGDEGIFLGILGGLAGGLVGSSIGKQLDEQDKKLMTYSAQNAFEQSRTGHSVAWQNPDNGHHGYIAPIRTYQDRNNRYCREFTQVVIIGGEEVKAYGTACRQPNGHWEIINSSSPR